MKRPLVVMTILAAGLLAPATAQAKGMISAMSACGESACASVVLPPSVKGPEGMMQLMAGGTTATPAPGPFYRLKMRAPGERFTIWYVPNPGVVSFDKGSWEIPAPDLDRAIRNAIAGLAPGRLQLAAVLVDGHNSSDPTAYTPLLGSMAAADVNVNDVMRNRPDWVAITLRPAGDTPWYDIGANYDPQSGAVYVTAPWHRGGWAQPSSALGSQVVADARLPQASDGGSDRGAMGIGLAVLLAASAGVAYGLRRARRRAQPGAVGSA